MLNSAGPFDICQGPNLTGLITMLGKPSSPGQGHARQSPGTVHRHAALAFSPLKFSALIERVFAFERRERFER
ncbi:MAG: hypothetical protein ACLSB9_00615 [Hydrogeniiclostridium mannosilyticum]